MEDVHPHQCGLTADLDRVGFVARDGVGIAGLHDGLLSIDDEHACPGFDPASLLVVMAVLGDDRSRFDMEVLDAHPLPGGQLGQMHTVDGFDGLTLGECDTLHAPTTAHCN